MPSSLHAFSVEVFLRFPLKTLELLPLNWFRLRQLYIYVYSWLHPLPVRNSSLYELQRTLRHFQPVLWLHQRKRFQFDTFLSKDVRVQTFSVQDEGPCGFLWVFFLWKCRTTTKEQQSCQWKRCNDSDFLLTLVGQNSLWLLIGQPMMNDALWEPGSTTKPNCETHCHIQEWIPPKNNGLDDSRIHEPEPQMFWLIPLACSVWCFSFVTQSVTSCAPGSSQLFSMDLMDSDGVRNLLGRSWPTSSSLGPSLREDHLGVLPECGWWQTSQNYPMATEVFY